ncbi:MAG: histidine kinase dimerization/phosphoacceptor domain-containing protein, partial [Acidobacteria bacterium]|nr:histidine kinase dimerization/phosphoacceptor domain-containing protein [Acidobacteriota bacterium]
LFTEGPNSPFFAFFIFVLLAAAYRWGLRETLATSAVAIAALFLETFLLAAGPWAIEPFVQGHFDRNRLIIRSAYLLLIAFLAGYLAEGEKQLRAESSVLARVMGKARVEIGLRGTLQEILDEFLQLFDTQQALLVFEEVNTGDLFLWKAGRDPEAGQTTLGLSEVEPEQRKTYFFPSPEDAWHMIRRNPGEQNSSFDLLALDSEGKWLRGAILALPGSFLERHPFSRALLVVSFQIRKEWLGRLFLLDPALGSSRIEELQFARTLMHRVLPAIYNIYLLRRLRSQVSLIERAHVARELHDGVMQTLTVAVMRMGLLRLQKAPPPQPRGGISPYPGSPAAGTGQHAGVNGGNAASGA